MIEGLGKGTLWPRGKEVWIFPNVFGNQCAKPEVKSRVCVLQG